MTDNCWDGIEKGIYLRTAKSQRPLIASSLHEGVPGESLASVALSTMIGRDCSMLGGLPLAYFAKETMAKTPMHLKAQDLQFGRGGSALPKSSWNGLIWCLEYPFAGGAVYLGLGREGLPSLKNFLCKRHGRKLSLVVNCQHSNFQACCNLAKNNFTPSR